MTKNIEVDGLNLKNEEQIINAYKPLSREVLSPTISITKKQIDSIVYYKRLITKKEDIEIKEGSEIPDDVLNHIVNYNYNVLSPNKTYCIDDRTTEQQEKGVSIPGGTDGLLAAAYHAITELGLTNQISAETIYVALLNTIGGEKEYYTHSDSHHINEKGKIGCGHCNVAFNSIEHVLDIPDNYKSFMISLREYHKTHHTLNILEGEHNPSGVILIDNSDAQEKLSIIQKGKNKQYFVYNRNAERNILVRFIKELNILENTKIKLSENQLFDITFKAYLSTLEHLGGNDLPHYTIKYKQDTNKFRIKTVGKVSDFIRNHKDTCEIK